MLLKHSFLLSLRWFTSGTIFTEDMRELESVYEYVIREIHNKATDGRFRVNTTASTLLTDDPFNLTRERKYPICNGWQHCFFEPHCYLKKHRTIIHFEYSLIHFIFYSLLVYFIPTQGVSVSKSYPGKCSIDFTIFQSIISEWCILALSAKCQSVNCCSHLPWSMLTRGLHHLQLVPKYAQEECTVILKWLSVLECADDVDCTGEPHLFCASLLIQCGALLTKPHSEME